MTPLRFARIARVWRPDAVLLPATFAVDLLLFSTFPGGRPEPTDPVRALQVVFTFACVLVLLARRRAPLAVFTSTCALAALGRLLDVGLNPTFVLLVALTALTERRRLGISVGAATAALVPGAIEVYLVALDLSERGISESQLGTSLGNVATVWVVLVGVAWGYGRWLGRNSRHIRHLETERERQRVLAEQAVAAERARIARELHDIVSNAVTMMVLHAAGGRRVVRGDPARAELAFGTIESAGTQAMGELRRLLGLLRDSGVASAEAPAESSSGLAALDAVVREVRSAGVTVRTEVQGEPERLDPSVDLAAFRVVQEALTNVAKHGGPGSSATVRIGWNPAWLDVRVDDDGAGRSPGSPAGLPNGLSTGHGLLGLRERLGVVGGTLSAGPGETGGYRVEARLPVAAEPAEDVAVAPV